MLCKLKVFWNAVQRPCFFPHFQNFALLPAIMLCRLKFFRMMCNGHLSAFISAFCPSHSFNAAQSQIVLGWPAATMLLHSLSAFCSSPSCNAVQRPSFCLHSWIVDGTGGNFLGVGVSYILSKIVRDLGSPPRSAMLEDFWDRECRSGLRFRGPRCGWREAHAIGECYAFHAGAVE